MPFFENVLDELLEAFWSAVGDLFFGPIFGRFFYGVGRIVVFLVSFGRLRCVEYEEIVPQHCLRWVGLVCRGEGRLRVTMRGAVWIGCVVVLSILAGFCGALYDSASTTS